MHCESTAPSKKILQMLFKMFDYNHDGILSKEEMFDMIKFNASSAGLNPESSDFTNNVNNMISEFTKPVTFDYFEEIINSHFETICHDNDFEFML